MQVVIVSGGASGIGRICEVFIKKTRQYKLYVATLTDRRQTLEEKYDGRCKFIKTDCGDGASCMNLIKRLLSYMGVSMF